MIQLSLCGLHGIKFSLEIKRNKNKIKKSKYTIQFLIYILNKILVVKFISLGDMIFLKNFTIH